MNEAESFQLRSEKEIFFEALDKNTPQERAAFLDGACGKNSALRAKVEALLADHFHEDAFMNKPAAAREEPVQTIKLGGAVNPNDEAVGQTIGRYKLLEKLGEGGCGAVYVAQQNEPVRRRVALKVIKLGMDTKQVVARFEAERQALAMMDHPNIAKVFDAGSTENGRPYFVMELVRGIKITEYCDQNQLNTKERLTLLVEVCHAVQHAHQKGIIHRDIKPSNIMVTLHDGVPVPKVIDFGIAKATEGRLTHETVYTQLHQFIGTPAYMSPEQAEISGLDVDTRSDIYSLGVLLYELLAGSTPFDAKELMASGLDAMRKTIREQEPVRPSTRFLTLQGEDLTTTAKRRSSDTSKLLHQLQGDLDWIVMKCLEKDRTRRYETANDLAKDIGRHLKDEAIVARPPSNRYRLQKLIRRNKLAFAAASAVFASLTIGLGCSIWLLVREKEARRDADAARANEAILRHTAEGREKIAWIQDLLDKRKFADAEKQMDVIPDSIVRTEFRETLSILGDLANWEVPEKRWQEAANHLGMLVSIQDAKGNFEQEWDSNTGAYVKYAPLLVALDDQSGYARFRALALARYGKSDHAPVAERVLISSLLVPADTEEMALLGGLADIAARTKPSDQRFATWAYAALALFNYRQGNYVGALEWGRNCVTNPSPSPPVRPRARAVMAMAYYQLNQTEAAQAELAQCREIIESKFIGKVVTGDWSSTGYSFDWMIDRILLREAEALMQTEPKNGGAPK